MSDTKSATELSAWLASIDAAECAGTLIAADIGMDVVRDLTDQDLRDLGLTIGQRKRLIRAITELNRRDTIDGDPDRLRAERRQLSVLFCDLVGSTGLSTRVDAEEFATILQDYYRLCASIATQWGGRMVSQHGDGVFVIFGHPRMHEDDAERAIRAGLQMIREIAASGPFGGEQLQSRVAVATGRVIIGDLTGVADPDSVAGETPNLAARLQGTVRPQELVIDERTMRLVSHAFELTPNPERRLRGFEKPVASWTVGRPRETRSRYDMLAPASLTDIFGREAEIELLSNRWQKALAGNGQVVVLRGEPGMGKSWLVSSFAARALTGEPGLRRLRLFCSAHHRNTALHPALDQLTWTAGVRASDDADRIRARLTEYFERWPDPIRGAADLVASQVLSGSGTSLDLNAAQRKIAMFRLLDQMLALEAERGPVLLEFEDAHWADPTSLELMTRLANVDGDGAPARRLMIIITHRPEFATGWPERPWIVERSLGRLSPADSAELARMVTGDAALPEARLREIVAKADGVPLFIREIARAVAEAGNDHVGGALEVPDTLENSLIARLDRLGPGKDVVQIAATLGRLFHETTLAEISGIDRNDLRTALAGLVDAELISPLPDAGVGAYLFRHALIQDAAYSSLLRRERRDIHARAAKTLAAEPAVVAPEILARHYAGAEMPLEAVGKLIEAGHNATSRAAQVEANNHFRTALNLLADAPKDANSLTLEATVHALLGQSLIATLGFGAPEIAQSFARARELSAETGNAPLQVASLYGLWAVSAGRGDRAETMALAGEAIAQFGDSEVPIFALAAHFMDGVTLLYDGQLDAAQAALERATSFYDPAMYPHLLQAFGDDLGTFALIYLQWICAVRADFTGAAALTQQIHEISARLDDRQIDARNLGFAASGAQNVGAVDLALATSDQLIDVATERCYPHWIATGRINRGWALCQQPGGESGIAEIEAGLAFFHMIGQRTPLSLCESVLAEAHLKLGRHDDARKAAEKAMATCETSLDRLYYPELKRLHAESLAPVDPEAAEAGLRAALDLARSGGMHYFGLKAATGLAHLLQGTRKSAEAIALLADVRRRVTQPVPLPVVAAADEILAAGAS